MTRLEVAPEQPQPGVVEVRVADPHEYPAIGAVTFAAYDADYGPLREDYARQLRHPEERAGDFEIWVAVRDGEIVGTTSILRDGRGAQELQQPGELYFRLLAVSPTARRQGVGSLLVDLADRLARERGREAVVLNSGPEMYAAHALYRSLGFTRLDRRRTVTDGDGRTFEILTFSRPVARETPATQV